MAEPITEVVGRLDEIPDGGSIRRTACGKEIALFRKGDQIYAIDAACPHRSGPLDGAALEEDFIVTCPWHGWRFDIRTGKSPTHPGQVSCYAVKVENGEIKVSATQEA